MMNITIFTNLKQLQNTTENARKTKNACDILINDLKLDYYYLSSSKVKDKFEKGDLIIYEGEILIALFNKNDFDFNANKIKSIYIDNTNIENICLQVTKKSDVLNFTEGQKVEELNADEVVWIDTGEYYFAWSM